MLMLAGTDPKDIIAHGILLLFFHLIVDKKYRVSKRGWNKKKKNLLFPEQMQYS